MVQHDATDTNVKNKSTLSITWSLYPIDKYFSIKSAAECFSSLMAFCLLLGDVSWKNWQGISIRIDWRLKFIAFDKSHFV